MSIPVSDGGRVNIGIIAQLKVFECKRGPNPLRTYWCPPPAHVLVATPCALTGALQDKYLSISWYLVRLARAAGVHGENGDGGGDWPSACPMERSTAAAYRLKREVRFLNTMSREKGFSQEASQRSEMT
jgi:hypothetical protein